MEIFENASAQSSPAYAFSNISALLRIVVYFQMKRSPAKVHPAGSACAILRRTFDKVQNATQTALIIS
ncbi:MAG: hypothetical protein K6E91_13255 [Butyrivibrio sp.]|nr:hypothetical protein [Butyrivibrio sp.]